MRGVEHDVKVLGKLGFIQQGGCVRQSGDVVGLVDADTLVESGDEIN